MSDLEDLPPSKRIKVDYSEMVESTNEEETYTMNEEKMSTSSKMVINPVATRVKGNTDGASTSQFNSVTEEELDKLRQFQVLDEVNDDDDSKDEDSDLSDKSDDLPDEEIDRMLEEALPEGFKGTPKQKEKAYITREKIVLEEKGINHFEVLPLDWMMVRHISGMPVYMHRGTRVCTLSKPYFLGKGNTRRHEIPISAIPCLAYRIALEEEEKQKEIDKSIEEQIANGSWADGNQQNGQNDNKPNNQEYKKPDSIETSSEPTVEKATVKCPFKHEPGVDDGSRTAEGSTQGPSDCTPKDPAENGTEASVNKDVPSRKPVVLPGGIVMPPPRVETVSTSWKSQHLTHLQINDYCKKLFKFKNVNIMHFKRWADRRKYVKARKTFQYPTLPEGTKLITIPAQNANGQEGGKGTKRDWVMNMNGCSYLSVFHEYVRRALQKQPVYEFKQLENAATPYQATVFIGGMQYGVGHGSSKRQAKSAAARASIHILIPEMKDELDDQTAVSRSSTAEPDFSFFDCVGIEDPRIQEFCSTTTEPSPHAILRTCLLRNFGAGDRHIVTEMKKLEYQKIELTMKVGKHSATVVCKNKKLAKQRASQAILQALHPHIRSWGSLLRLYGSRSVKSCKEKKIEEQQITLLQDKAQQNEPNYAVLDKLKSEMRKLKQRDQAVVPIGTLMVADDLPTHSGSMLNNVDL